MSEGLDIVRAAIPDADEQLARHILWGRTPFPFVKITAQDLYRAAARYRRVVRNGIILCDWCDQLVRAPGTCPRCSKALACEALEVDDAAP